tara:strand:+ start:262 stop:822 length:561 start_codon:yes stop_codon:yes gene_type:complete
MEFLSSCETEYNSSKQVFKKIGNKIYFTYFGEFDSKKIAEITAQNEEYLKKIGTVKKTIKTSFNILIEGLQNIINHGEISPNGKQLAFYNIGEKDNHITMNFSNLIKTNNIQYVEKKINHLNRNNPSGIKEIYIETLTNGEISKKGGAGLGLITMAMKSKNKIEFHSKLIDSSLSMITIEIKINKI